MTKTDTTKPKLEVGKMKKELRKQTEESKMGNKGEGVPRNVFGKQPIFMANLDDRIGDFLVKLLKYFRERPADSRAQCNVFYFLRLCFSTSWFSKWRRRQLGVGTSWVLRGGERFEWRTKRRRKIAWLSYEFQAFCHDCERMWQTR